MRSPSNVSVKLIKINVFPWANLKPICPTQVHNTIDTLLVNTVLDRNGNAPLP